MNPHHTPDTTRHAPNFTLPRPRSVRARGHPRFWLMARVALGLVVGSIGAAAELATPAAGAAGGEIGADGAPAQPPAAAMPDSAQGKCAAAYFAMMESASPDGAKAFENTWSSKARLSRSSMDVRVGRAGELRAQWGRLTPERVVGSSEASLTVAVRSENAGTMRFEFRFDAAEPAKLDGIVISEGPGVAAARSMSPDARAAVVAGAARSLREGYVYPKVAETMAAAIEGKLEAGDYDSVTDEMALAERLTDDLRAVSRDRHLGVMLVPADAGGEQRVMPGPDRMRRENFAFKKVEILPGNVGLLRFDLFMDEDEARKAAGAALAFLANCDAIIFDLRANGGGSPEMIRFITSYLFDKPTHLNDMIDRDGNTVEEYWTVSEIPGTRFAPDLPVYVLTSSRTFSGAEEFSYNLKNLGRATIVGETTGGGAHPVRAVRLSDRFLIRVPFMRANNPISKTNWEGTGVEPDVKVAAADALDRAQALAREAIQKRSKN